MDELELPKILIVDDRPENLLSLELLFEDEPVEVVRALSGNDALALSIKYEFAVVLLDVQMPEMDGFETATLMRSNKKTSKLPIIFVTAINKEKKQIIMGYQAGAVDYIFKPYEPEIVRSKVNILLELYKQRKTIEHSNEKLKEANNKIIEQQKALVEEERIKVLLQMAGATAHELNQPLMILLSSIELLQEFDTDPEEINERLKGIKEAGQRIAETVKKIQFVRHDQTKAYPGEGSIIDIQQKINVLWVEDDDFCFTAFSKMVSLKRDCNMVRAISVEGAKKIISEMNIDLAIFDFTLPDGDAFELLRMMKKQKKLAPVIVLSGYGDEMTAARCIQAGAAEYLSKANIEIEDLNVAIGRVFERYQFENEKEKAVAKMAKMATYDELTGIYNRRYMNESLSSEFSRAVRYDSELSCLLFDIDYFKRINDGYGHLCGDSVLKDFAGLIKNSVRETDTLFRYGGEEFLLLMPQTDVVNARQIAEKIRQKCQYNPFLYEDISINLTVSIGVASFKDCLPETPKEFLSYADKALYQAKAGGRNRFRVYNDTPEVSAEERFVYGGKGIQYLKKQLDAILDKTKKATLSSIELLVKDIGGIQIEEHTNQMQHYLSLMCEKSNITDNTKNAIMQSAVFHGCLKLLMGVDLLQKKEALTPEEEEMINNFPYIQIDMLDQFDFYSNEKAVLLAHSEFYNGKGYPEGLKANEIPPGARMFSIADAVTAMTSQRPYRDDMSDKEILDELVKNAGEQFDPYFVNLFLDLVSENKLLDLSDEEIAHAKKTIKMKE